MAFWTLKSSARVEREQRAAAEREAQAREASRTRDPKVTVTAGLRYQYQQERLRIDEEEQAMERFFGDIEDYFDASRKFLGTDYESSSKFEGPTKGERRRFGIKWPGRLNNTHTDKGILTEQANLAFVFTEGESLIRLDFILDYNLIGDDEQSLERTNLDYERSGNAVVNEARTESYFKTVMRYRDYNAFVESGDTIPEWFADNLARFAAPSRRR